MNISKRCVRYKDVWICEYDDGDGLIYWKVKKKPDNASSLHIGQFKTYEDAINWADNH